MQERHQLTAAAVHNVVAEIKTVLDSARSNVARQVNSELLNTYWHIGRIIAEYEQTQPERADYGKQTLRELSRVLTDEFGKGFSRANLYNMRQFYMTYEKIQTLSGQLSWSHYCELLSISDADKRSFYEKEAVTAEYALGGLSNNIFASRYVLYMPNKEQLIAQVESVMKLWREKQDEENEG